MGVGGGEATCAGTVIAVDAQEVAMGLKVLVFELDIVRAIAAAGWYWV